jgi:NhaA family Na+:H+ antiporter
VGLELKREILVGELASLRDAALPVVAAAGGMMVPALIYAGFNAGTPGAGGWGIPMATDIAFAVGILVLLAWRVPKNLIIFLTALAIADDLGAVLVIALFYTHGLSLPALAAAALAFAFAWGMKRAGVRAYLPYWGVGAAVWLATLASGIHATVAGVLLGLLTPASIPQPAESLAARAKGWAQDVLELVEGDRLEDERRRVARGLGGLSREALSPLEALTGALHPWVAFVVMPVFALANAGVVLEVEALADPLTSRVTLAVVLGLLIGKPVGITLLSWLAVRLGIAVLPAGVGWTALFGAGCLGGIGFTMALFITALAFQDPPLAAASKLGVMLASVLASAAGLLVLARALPRAAR